VDLLLLTHTGARTGRTRTTPLGHLVHGDDLVVVAANRGSAHHPSWYHNLVAHPRVTVEVGSSTFDAVAHVAAGDERDRLWDFVATAKPFFLDFAAKAAPREIPIIVLRRG
jgi:deazaflavin-dependent oxidoreductase (nitroreductase family)